MKRRISIELDNPSKAEEIQVLENIRDIVRGRNLYLTSLFTDEMVEWVSKQIKNDIMPDLYAHYKNATNIEVEELRERISELERTLKAERSKTKGELEELLNQLEEVEKEKYELLKFTTSDTIVLI